MRARVAERTVGHLPVTVAVQALDDLVQVLVLRVLRAVHVPNQLLDLVLRAAEQRAQRHMATVLTPLVPQRAASPATLPRTLSSSPDPSRSNMLNANVTRDSMSKLQ